MVHARAKHFQTLDFEHGIALRPALVPNPFPHNPDFQ